MTENDLTAAVLELLDLFGWRAVHARPARTAHGWRTPLQGPTAAGFPDIFAVKGNRILAAELKVGRNRVTPEQAGWLKVLALAGAEAYEWRDTDWTDGTIEAVIRRPTAGGELAAAAETEATG
jgi:hypothetical protein